MIRIRKQRNRKKYERENANDGDGGCPYQRQGNRNKPFYCY